MKKLASPSVLALLLACGATFHRTPLFEAHRASSITSPYTNIVVIVQENRTTDNLFHRLPGADTADFGYTKEGKKVTLVPRPLAQVGDLSHDLGAYTADYDGGLLDGFSLGHKSHDYLSAYTYVQHSDIRPYWDMARSYTFADRMFTSNIDASFVSHQYLIAGQAGGAVDFPSTTCGGDHMPTIHVLTTDRQIGGKEPACFDYRTILDELRLHGYTWSYYAAPLDFMNRPVWIPTEYIKHLAHSVHVRVPETTFFTDFAAGDFANVTFITPSLPNSDHVGSRQNYGGPAWVGSIVNTIGESPYWESTLILVTWDDWGGWYDHVLPPYLDYDGDGFRVPFIAIGPYVKKGYVTHVGYEVTSILKDIENNYGLGPLAPADARAPDFMSDVNDFTQAPRKFRRIPTRGMYLLDPDHQAVDT